MRRLSIESRLYQTVLVLLALLPLSNAAATPLLQKVTSLSVSDHEVIIDTRPLASCRQSSLPAAICLPVEDILAPQRRLANWSGIQWLLGSAGLSGNEHVLVTGQRPARREFIAGLLVLAGQHRVTVLDSPVVEMLPGTHQGTARSTTRTRVYAVPMRSDLIVLQSELLELTGTSAVLLDGRSEDAYYGVSINAARGGHIPGAVHRPLPGLLDSASVYQSVTAVSYAHDVFDSLVYFSALQMAGVPARVYLAGWVEWASIGALPVDSVSYPRAMINHGSVKSGQRPVNVPANAMPAISAVGVAVLALLAALALLAGGFITGRRFRARNT